MFSENGLDPFERDKCGKPEQKLPILQSFLIRSKTSLRLFGEVLIEAKKLSGIVEWLFHALERVFVVFVCLVLTAVGAVTLLSWKIDLPHLVEWLKNLLGF